MIPQSQKRSRDLFLFGEIAKLEYDRSTQIFTIDRDGMKLGGRGQRRFKIFADKNFKLRLFIDRTALELFVQDGEEVASFFLFPEKDVEPKMILTGDSNFNRVRGNIFKLDSFKFE